MKQNLLLSTFAGQWFIYFGFFEEEVKVIEPASSFLIFSLTLNDIKDVNTCLFIKWTCYDSYCLCQTYALIVSSLWINNMIPQKQPMQPRIPSPVVNFKTVNLNLFFFFFFVSAVKFKCFLLRWVTEHK